MNLNSRIIRLIKTFAQEQIDFIDNFIQQGDELLDDKLNNWEKKFDFSDQKKSSTSNFPPQLIEDLELFNLQPPSNKETVKKKRNQEIKKYHPDKFQNDPEKLETAKRILQIYNTAYERLMNYYN